MATPLLQPTEQFCIIRRKTNLRTSNTLFSFFFISDPNLHGFQLEKRSDEDELRYPKRLLQGGWGSGFLCGRCRSQRAGSSCTGLVGPPWLNFICNPFPHRIFCSKMLPLKLKGKPRLPRGQKPLSASTTPVEASLVEGTGCGSDARVGVLPFGSQAGDARWWLQQR